MHHHPRIPRPAFLVFAVLLVLPLLAGCADPGVEGGSIHLDSGRVEEAEAQFREALARNPNDPQAHFLLAQSLALQGKARDADIHYRRAVELDAGYQRRVDLDRDRFMARFQEQALSLTREGRLGEARTMLDSADAMRLDDGKTLALRGRLAEASEGRDAAIPYYRRALQVHPADPDLRRTLAEALVASGRLHYESHEYPVAWSNLEEAVTLDDRPEYHYLMGSVAYAWARRSEGEERQRQLDNAVRSFQSVLERTPADEDASFNLGAVLLAAGRYDDAVTLYRGLVARNPRDGELYLALSRAHGFLGESDLAAGEEAAGMALRANDPVEDAATWAKRSAERFPGSDLAAAFYERRAPEDIYTYRRTGGGLVEVWFWWRDGVAAAFREGGSVGGPIPLGAR